MGGLIGSLPEKASNNMLQEPSRLLLHKLSDHVAEDGPNRIEPLIGGANVVESIVIQQDLLYNEDGDSLAELRTGLHDAEAQRDDFCRQQEVDHLARVVLDQGADDAKRGQAKVFEGPRLGGRIQEGVQKEGNVS